VIFFIFAQYRHRRKSQVIDLKLFCRFLLLAVSQSHARAAAVLVDELDAGGLQRTPDR
jgi:hypothetical protein